MTSQQSHKHKQETTFAGSMVPGSKTAPLPSITPSEPISPTAFKSSIFISLALAATSIGVSSASTTLSWLSILSNSDNQSSPKYLYSPFELKFCSNNRCEPDSRYTITACSIFRTGGDSRGPQLCSLDENLKGLVITTILLSITALVSIGVILGLGHTNVTQKAFAIPISTTFLTVIFSGACIGVGQNMKGVLPGMFDPSVDYSKSNNSGFTAQIVCLVASLLAFLILATVSFYVPGDKTVAASNAPADLEVADVKDIKTPA
ncbi:hypothetical protein HDU97_004948 [Phlyctochytrium planicorne]|nr:hypothetical protein HDU97_004948 [Phlyctochytrium planicorne]